jgi:hypothetical protein
MLGAKKDSPSRILTRLATIPGIFENLTEPR